MLVATLILAVYFASLGMMIGFSVVVYGAYRHRRRELAAQEKPTSPPVAPEARP